MFSLPGAAALSRFRLDKLLADLRLVRGAVTAVAAQFEHYVATASPPGEQDRTLLGRLLGPGPATSPATGPEIAATADAAVHTVCVTPRVGTVSAWSSKATDIAQVCGLHFVRRLERGIVYRLRANGPTVTGALRSLRTRSTISRPRSRVWRATPPMRNS
jgi:phosphoribosylformylglycinamidine synthase